MISMREKRRKNSLIDYRQIIERERWRDGEREREREREKERERDDRNPGK